MIYFENSLRQEEGFNTHVMRYTLCIAISNFIDRDFYFAGGRPSNTPPDYAVSGPDKDRYSILMKSERSDVLDLVRIPNRRRLELGPKTDNSIEVQVMMSYFFTTEELRSRYENSFIWNAFSVGRFALIREELQKHDLIEFTHQTLSSPAYCFFLRREEKNALLRSVQLRYIEEIESLAATIVAGLGRFYAVHIRLGDFREIYGGEGYEIREEDYKKYIAATFPNRELPVVIATDALHEKELLSRLFDGYQKIFLDEHIFDNYFEAYRVLPFTDFNVLTIIDQLVCAAAELFIGTYRSTFTNILHRLRQERYEKKDVNFFPAHLVSKLVGPCQTIRPDKSGFFDWNRYSVFSANHNDMSWRREWDHDLTSLDL